MVERNDRTEQIPDGDDSAKKPWTIMGGLRSLIGRALGGGNAPKQPEQREDFRVTLDRLCTAMQRLTHDEYVRLVQFCKGQITEKQLFVPPSERLRQILTDLGLFHARNDAGYADVLRLTRYVLPGEGIDVHESIPERRGQGFDPRATIKVTLLGADVNFSIRPADDTARLSVVQTDKGTRTLARGERLTLGRAGMTIRNIFGHELPKPRPVPCDLQTGGPDKMSRSCIQVSRDQDDRIRIVECGAKHVTGIHVVATMPRGTGQKAEQEHTMYEPATGASRLLTDEEAARIQEMLRKAKEGDGKTQAD